jgi:hypothetical protein
MKEERQEYLNKKKAVRTIETHYLVRKAMIKNNSLPETKEKQLIRPATI